MIICSTCKEEKELNQFHNSAKLHAGYRVKCKKCANLATRKSYIKHNQKQLIKSREYRSSNPDAGRNARFKYKYGISLEEYNLILKAQDYKCAICPNKHTLKSKLDVDHSHDTGKVRGLLCRRCNLAIGQFKDSMLLLESAIKYLENNGQR